MLLLALRRQRAASGKGADGARGTPSPFRSFARGMQELSDALAATLPAEQVRTGTSVQVLTRGPLPGPTWTDGVQNYFHTLAEQDGKPVDELIRNYFADQEPTSLLQRFVDVEEVADATVFLTSNRRLLGGMEVP